MKHAFLTRQRSMRIGRREHRVRIQIKQVLILIANKIQRSLRFTAHNANALAQMKALLEARDIRLIKRIQTEAERHKNQIAFAWHQVRFIDNAIIAHDAMQARSQRGTVLNALADHVTRLHRAVPMPDRLLVQACAVRDHVMNGERRSGSVARVVEQAQHRLIIRAHIVGRVQVRQIPAVVEVEAQQCLRRHHLRGAQHTTPACVGREPRVQNGRKLAAICDPNLAVNIEHNRLHHSLCIRVFLVEAISVAQNPDCVRQ
mmetsp:Transcript_44906/g.74399  ORF Transcript_44906/g.74399 Transcript_44906/m.74399 type:complete len:259 (+) Transcript_44906:291-1067(+)